MIDNDDLTKQEKIYTRQGAGRWVVQGYCATPSVTMVNIDTSETVSFGLNGLMNKDFIDTGEIYDRNKDDSATSKYQEAFLRSQISAIQPAFHHGNVLQIEVVHNDVRVYLRNGTKRQRISTGKEFEHNLVAAAEKAREPQKG